MAAVNTTASLVGLIFPQTAEVYDFIAAETIVAGQALYVDANGKVGLAGAAAAGKQQVRGIALNGGGAGQAISVLKRGHLAGATLSIAYDSIVYLSDTLGALADAAGTLSVRVGRVVPLSDSSLTKCIYVEADWLRNW